MSGGKHYVEELLVNPHTDLALPCKEGSTSVCKGEYLFYHYGCDGYDDRGWGCGYRTLMTLCSWIRRTKSSSNTSCLPPVPSNHEIQQILVKMQDKPSSFYESRDWIGCVEAGLVLDELYGVQCRILHVSSGDQLRTVCDALENHFTTVGSPVMMGGDSDNMSKGIVGMCVGRSKTYLLVVDPHFWGRASDARLLYAKNWITWKPLDEFNQTSFYNLCLPLLKYS